MANSNRVMIHKLQNAINDKFGAKILFNKTQWYSDSQNRPVTLYIIKQAVWDDEIHKSKNVELFSSCSMIQIVLFLRDLWYELNGWAVPQDNEKWEQAKVLYYSKQEPNGVDVTLPDGRNKKKHLVRKDGWDEVKK